MQKMRILISLLVVSLGAAACNCGGGQLISTPDQHGHPVPPTPDAGPMPPPVTPMGCTNDCDCGPGTVCLSTGGELSGNSCQMGTNTCDRPCTTPCGAGTTCQMGVCVTAPCVGPNCNMTMMPPGGVGVAGTYKTSYTFDIHDFASKAADISQLLDVLSAALNGNLTCGSSSGAAAQLICIAVNLIAQNIHAPPWVGQLITVLNGIFKFGDTPITAHGTMQLAEAADGTLSAAETWSDMWMNYNGMTYNVMNSPTLGTNGQFSVTVKAFGGTRTVNEVILGPRDVNFDVNKLLVNLINVAISAGSNNQAHDVGELLTLVLCDQLPITSSDHAVCVGAATQLAQVFKLNSGLGGIHIDEQRGLIYDDDNDGHADAFGRDMPISARGTVRGNMSNGLVSGDLGPFPKSNWFGVK